MGTWERIKSAAKRAAGAVAAGAGIVLALLFWRRRKAPGLEQSDAELGRRVDAANARAGAQIEQAVEKEADIAVDLAEIAEDEDGERRRARLIAEAERVEGGGKKR